MGYQVLTHPQAHSHNFSILHGEKLGVDLGMRLGYIWVLYMIQIVILAYVHALGTLTRILTAYKCIKAGNIDTLKCGKWRRVL